MMVMSIILGNLPGSWVSRMRHSVYHDNCRPHTAICVSSRAQNRSSGCHASAPVKARCQRDASLTSFPSGSAQLDRQRRGEPTNAVPGAGASRRGAWGAAARPASSSHRKVAPSLAVTSKWSFVNDSATVEVGSDEKLSYSGSTSPISSHSRPSSKRATFPFPFTTAARGGVSASPSMATAGVIAPSRAASIGRGGPARPWQ
mmetsp:Transcript_45213/g.79601  ORF Transcript_45213/g.79601 Transcript_45213/m.79601 type:complete len:202 (-) Transcript_45213:2272-2877(-)